MNRKMKKLAVGLCAATLFATLTGQAFASTADITFSKYMIGNSYNTLMDAGSKDDTSPLYVYVTSSVNSAYRVQAMGCATTTVNLAQLSNKTWANGQYVQYVRCQVGQKYNVSSKIKEDGYSEATIKIYPEGGSGTVAGKWSPDSKGTYNTPTAGPAQ